MPNVCFDIDIGGKKAYASFQRDLSVWERVRQNDFKWICIRIKGSICLSSGDSGDDDDDVVDIALDVSNNFLCTLCY